MTLDVKLKASSTPAGLSVGQNKGRPRELYDRALVQGPTVSVMQVNVHVKDSLIPLSQSEDSQHGVVDVTEPRRFVPADRRGQVSFVSFLEKSFIFASICILFSVVPASSPVDGYITLLVQKTLSCCQRGAAYRRRVVEYALHHWTVIACRQGGVAQTKVKKE